VTNKLTGRVVRISTLPALDHFLLNYECEIYVFAAVFCAEISDCIRRKQILPRRYESEENAFLNHTVA